MCVVGALIKPVRVDLVSNVDKTRRASMFSCLRSLNNTKAIEMCLAEYNFGQDQDKCYQPGGTIFT